MSGILLVMSSSSVDYRNWNNKLSKTANTRNIRWHIIFISKCINNNMAPWTINSISNVIQQTCTWGYKTNKRGKIMSSYCNILLLLFAYVHFFPADPVFFCKFSEFQTTGWVVFFLWKVMRSPYYIYIIVQYTVVPLHTTIPQDWTIQIPITFYTISGMADGCCFGFVFTIRYTT